MSLNTVVTRNGVDKQLTKGVFGKKSDNAGKEFWYPEISISSIENDLKWLGLDEAANTLNREYRSVFADIYLDNIDENTGALNEEQMQADWADFTAGVAKLADIEAELDALQAEQQKYALEPEHDFGGTNEDGTPTEQAKKTGELIKAINLKIKPLRVQRASIETKYKARAEARKAKKAKAEAAAKAKAGSSPVAEAAVA